MGMRFDPQNAVVKRCLIGMGLEEGGNIEEAVAMFQKAWNESTDDYERFIAAYHLARLQKNVADKLNWLETSLQCALNVNDENVTSAYPTLYSSIAKCYEALPDPESAKKYDELARSYQGPPADRGPFYHGTKADLQVGDLLTAGGQSNYQPSLQMNHIYFTANLNGAALAAALATGKGRERVYIVEPTGEFENDPNVTDKKFPGNLTRSYRSQEPLRIVGEATDWGQLSDAERQRWRDNVAKTKGEIIN